MIFKSESVVLHTRKFGDTSKIVTLFTRESGKLTVIAKGARQQKSKFTSSLEPLSVSSVIIYRRPNRDLHLLNDAEIAVPLRRISDSFEHLATGLLILESVAQTQDDNAPNPELYDYLTESLIILNKLEPNPYSVFVKFQLYLAEQIGFGLDLAAGLELLDNTVNPSGRSMVFDIETGSLRSAGTAANGNAFHFDAKVFESLQKISALPLGDVSGISIPGKMNTQVHNFFVRYFSYHLEKKFSYKSYNLFNLG